MLNQTLSFNSKIEINSDKVSDPTYNFVVEKSCNLVVEIKGNKEVEIKIDCQIKQDASLKMLIINSNLASVTINDQYKINGNSDTVVAYCQFNQADVLTNSTYQLVQPNANLRVLTASITNSKKTFNQEVLHLADHSSANVDNYGIVLKDGDVSLIVKNTIGKDKKYCSTHQSNRLLTYDKKAKAKVLPILYIDDNEVEASHGCSMGQPDENQIYYLMSRGLTRKQALDLITIGYLMPITQICDDNLINEAIKNEIVSKVNANA